MSVFWFLQQSACTVEPTRRSPLSWESLPLAQFFPQLRRVCRVKQCAGTYCCKTLHLVFFSFPLLFVFHGTHHIRLQLLIVVCTDCARTLPLRACETDNVSESLLSVYFCLRRMENAGTAFKDLKCGWRPSSEVARLALNVKPD